MSSDRVNVVSARVTDRKLKRLDEFCKSRKITRQQVIHTVLIRLLQGSRRRHEADNAA